MDAHLDLIGAILEKNLPPNVWSVQQGCESYDQALEEAERQAVASGTLTPIVKQELRLLIQTRRLSQGKDEMQVAFVQPKNCKLTKEEEDKRSRRKEQNKHAARRFRRNKKLKESTLTEDVAMLEAKNAGLREKIEELKLLKDSLIHHLTHHLVACPYYQQIPTPALVAPSGLELDFPGASGHTDFQATCSTVTTVGVPLNQSFDQHPRIP